MQLHCQGNSKCSLPKLDSKIEPSCLDCLGFPERLFEFSTPISFDLKWRGTNFSACYPLIQGKHPSAGVSSTFLASGYQVEVGGWFDSICLLTLYKFIKSSRGNMPE